MYQKILLAVNGSEQSTKAAQKLAEMQSQWNAEIVIFHSVQHNLHQRTYPLPFVFNNNRSFQIPNDIYNQFHNAYKDYAENMLQGIKQIFDNAGVGDNVSTRLIEDQDPADYAKSTVETEQFELVVLGAKGQHSKLHEIFLGSVCEKIMNLVSCDVLVIK